MIDAYTKSHFDLSIGTGAAIAAITQANNTVYVAGDGSSLDVKVYTGSIDYLVVNVETIARNIIQAIDSSIRSKVLNSYISYIYELVIREIIYIDNITDSKTNKGVYFFFPNYKKVYDVYYTQKRKALPTQRELLREAVDNISFSISKKANGLNINYILDDHIIKLKGNILFLTHYGQDLLNYKHNHNIKLLESHTGKVIEYTNFNKKYRNSIKADVSRLPWNEVLVMCIGTETITSPVKGALRKVLEVAEKNNWNPNTSMEKVRNNLSKVQELKDFTKFKGVY